MEDIDSSPISPNPRKRAAPGEDTPGKKPLNLKGTQFVMPTPPDTEESSNASPSSNEQRKEGSPVPSISTMTSVEIVGSNAVGASTQADSGSKPPPAKRRKLTQAEKEREKAEKEAKAKEKAEQKARKEEEKRAQDEIKRQKAEEKEAKKREKELEEQRKADAKLKKERSQMRLGVFFGAKSATPGKSPAPTGLENGGSARRKSLSLEPYEAVADQLPTPVRRSASPTKGAPPQPGEEQQPSAPPTITKPKIPDYHRYFLPFELPSHSTLAPTYSIPNPDDQAYWQGEFEREVRDPSIQEMMDLGLVEEAAVTDHKFSTENTARGIRLPNVRALVDQIQGTSQQPIDLTVDNPVPSQQVQPLGTLQDVPRRYLHFEEDVRPAYFGTYTKIRSPRSTRRLMLNPFSRTRRDTDYDYDSEAEWEEPEEGDEDLADDEDEAESTGEPDEMDGFLDDEEDALKSKRKMITGDLQPSCTGLCWENDKNTIVRSIEIQAEDGSMEESKLHGTPKEMSGMRIGFLLPNLSAIQTIDPFSSAYWAAEMAPPDVPITFSTSTTNLARPPLQERHANSPSTQPLLGAAEGEKGPITTLAATQAPKKGPKAPPKQLPKEDLEGFKEAVVGSPLGKVELCKGLKAR